MAYDYKGKGGKSSIRVPSYEYYHLTPFTPPITTTNENENNNNNNDDNKNDNDNDNDNNMYEMNS